jgi:predicted DNA-binding WGR domain protein
VTSIDKEASGHYRARFRAPDGASRSKTFKRKVDAKTFLTEVEHSKKIGGYVDARARKDHLRSFRRAMARRADIRRVHA